MNTKQHLNKIDQNTIRLPVSTIAKLSNQKPPLQQNKSKAFNKQFTNVTCSIDKINRHINHKIKNIYIKEILLTTTQVRLAISNSTNNNSTQPDGINIRYLKHLGSLAIKYLTNMYNAALNTNTIPHLGENAISISKPNKDHNIGTNYQATHITFAKHCQNTRITHCQKLENGLLPEIIDNILVISYQYRFKYKHSTYTALHNISHQIAKGFNNPRQHTL